jgi:ribose transport system permease protein
VVEKPSRFKTISFYQQYGLIPILIVILVAFAFIDPGTFLTSGNLKGILLVEIVPAIVAFAVLVPIMAGEFDLSVGYNLGLCSVVCAATAEKWGVSGGVAIALALLAGMTVGLVNGILVSVFRYGSLIATLGVGLAVSGIAVGLSGSRTLFEAIPPFLGKVTTTEHFGLASGIWLTLVIAIILYLVTSHTPFGRRLAATGANERVAQLAGVRTGAVKIIAFVTAGLLAAIAGLFEVGLTGGANPGYGANLLLPAFAAVFLGQTAIRPGNFNVWGTVLAILILTAGFSGLSLAGVPFWVEPVFDGLILLVAVFFARGRGRAETG